MLISTIVVLKISQDMTHLIFIIYIFYHLVLAEAEFPGWNLIPISYNVEYNK